MHQATTPRPYRPEGADKDAEPLDGAKAAKSGGAGAARGGDGATRDGSSPLPSGPAPVDGKLAPIAPPVVTVAPAPAESIDAGRPSSFDGPLSMRFDKGPAPTELPVPRPSRRSDAPPSSRLREGRRSSLPPPARESANEGVLCGWTLRERLAAGPVCDSWSADTSGRKETAIVRRLREPFASDENARTEWLRASWAANRFEHARVPKVLEEGKDPSGAPVVVRKWVKGEDLGRIVARSRIDRALALRIAEQVLDALEMAHAHGIVHGAITPSNIIVTPRGSIRLVDFATTPGLLARRAGAVDTLAAARLSPFSAPERRHSSAAPAAEPADIWSLAACLYYALTGTPPSGPAPSLKRAAPGLDPNLAAVVDLALSHAPYERYESAYAMLGDIRRVMAGNPPKLEAAVAPVPSQGMPELPPPSIGPQSLARPASDDADTEATAAAKADAARREWRGNLFLMVAIALLVGIASFVLFREKLADAPDAREAPAHEAR